MAPLVAVGYSPVGGVTLTTSPDGITWTTRTTPFDSLPEAYLHCVMWSPDLGLFVAGGTSVVGGVYDGILATSPDGVTWTEHASDLAVDVYDITWSPSLALFVAVGYGDYGSGGWGDSNMLATSPDGIAWTKRASPGYEGLIYGVTWSPELSLFVAVGAMGMLKTSPDGITWTQRTGYGSPGDYLPFGESVVNDAAWSPSLGLFVAVSNSAKLATSPDGTTWTIRTNGFGDYINGVTWSPELSLFVAVGSSGKLATSPDGITWTQRTSGFSTTTMNIQCVMWSPDLGLFVAGGTSGRLTTSPDGITWTARTSGFGGSVIAGVAGVGGVEILAVTRLFPRDDGRGLSSAPRIFPPPKSRRVVGGYQ